MNGVTQTTGRASSPEIKMPRTDLRAPDVAWPTIAVFAACLLVWTGSSIAALAGSLPLWIATLLNSAAAFAVFTPMHDASHRSVARSRWVNEIVGRLSVLLLIGPFPAFRFVHQEHHKYTNDEEKDPDHWSGLGPTILLPLRWMTQDFHYYYVYLKRWNERPAGERWETLLTLVALYGLLLGLIIAGYGVPVLLLWFVPSRIAQTFLALTFDYLPHRPHTITAAEDRYKATLILLHPLLTVAFLYQNYHLIHHLYPGVPFYRMADIWRTQRDYLISKGATVLGKW